MRAKKWLCKICADGCYLAGTDRQISFCRSYKPKTNADRIRAMSDEELLFFLGEYRFTNICEEGCDECHYHGDCDRRLMDWLRQPVKEGDNE